MIGVLSAVLCAAIVAGVLWLGLAARRCRMVTGEKLGWFLAAGGLAWAGPARFLGHPAGLGDLLFVAGVLIVLLSLHGGAMLKKADALDGRVDGRLGVIPLHRGAHIADGPRPEGSAFPIRRGPGA